MGVGAGGEADEATPFTTMPIEKRVMVATPAGAKLAQIKAEQPATTYEMFNRQIVNEEARSLNMPYNIAACDSSGYSFSGGRLDHLTYYVSVDVERSEAEQQVLDRVFAAWFREATLANRWSFDAAPAPKHAWDWPAMPQIDQQKTATARKTAMSFGGTRLGSIYAEDGLDYEDEVAAMATEFGLTVEEMKARLLECALPKNSQPAEAADKPGRDEGEDKGGDDGEDFPPAKAGNGHAQNRFSLTS
jgi:capsid protein